jgi:hypothetical protein
MTRGLSASNHHCRRFGFDPGSGRFTQPHYPGRFRYCGGKDLIFKPVGLRGKSNCPKITKNYKKRIVIVKHWYIFVSNEFNHSPRSLSPKLSLKGIY